MQINGWIKQSLMDYPGKIASVVFTQGCNFRCPYCHNPELIPMTSGSLAEETILQHLDKNRFLLDGVVITGGEPTLQADLIGFIKEIRSLNLAVKLDTNGSRPQLLNELIGEKLVDYIAMDVKSAHEPERYGLAAGVPVSQSLLEKIETSMHLIVQSGIDHEFRTTVCRELIQPKDLDLIVGKLSGCRRYFLQQYRPFEQNPEGCRIFSAYPENWINQFTERWSTELNIRFRD
ncbi:MAG: anaerobic ribonucleoside-triphosphate reductase activating protein [Mangrovibacterium sp.]